MPPPIDDATRERVLNEARAGASRNEVARRTGVSTASVSRICGAAGHAFNRTRTEVATFARTVDLKAARTAASAAALLTAETMRQLALTADESREARDYAQAYAVFLDRHLKLDRHDIDSTGLSAVDAWLTAMIGGEEDAT